MINCAYCGNQINEDQAFCPYCLGQVVKPEPPEKPAAESGNNEVILVNRAGCGMEMSRQLLRDLMGYSEREADRLIFAVPVRIGVNLSRMQAVTLAGIFSEKGCQTAVFFGNDQDVTDILSRSSEQEKISHGGLQVIQQDKTPDVVYFRADGSLNAEAEAVIATLSEANKVKDFSTYTFYNPGEMGRDYRLMASGGSNTELAKADKADQKTGILIGIGLAALVLIGSLFGKDDSKRSHQYDRGGAMGAAGGFGRTGSRASAKGLRDAGRRHGRR